MYNAYNIPISRVSLLFETKDLKYLSRYWMPNIVLSFLYKKFIKKYNEFFNEKDSKKAIGDNWIILRLKNKMNNLFPALYYALIYGGRDRDREIYKEHFGKYPETVEDLNRIVSEIGRLSDKLDILNSSQKEEKQGLSFSELVPAVEGSRNIPIDRNITLFEFYELYKIEIKKWQQNQ